MQVYVGNRNKTEKWQKYELSLSNVSHSAVLLMSVCISFGFRNAKSSNKTVERQPKSTRSSNSEDVHLIWCMWFYLLATLWCSNICAADVELFTTYTCVQTCPDYVDYSPELRAVIDSYGPEHNMLKVHFSMVNCVIFFVTVMSAI